MNKAEQYYEDYINGLIEDLNEEPDNGKFADCGDSEKSMIIFNDGSAFIYWWADDDNAIPYYPNPVRDPETVKQFMENKISCRDFIKLGAFKNIQEMKAFQIPKKRVKE